MDRCLPFVAAAMFAGWDVPIFTLAETGGNDKLPLIAIPAQ